MNLLEKYCRDTMPQISTEDIEKVKKVFKSHDIRFSEETVKLSTLGDLQSSVDKEKVSKIAKVVEEDGVDSMPAMLVSNDNKVIDGHHRKHGIIEAEGRDAEAKILRLDYTAEEARLILKGLEDKLSERIGTAIELMALALHNGQATESIFINNGFARKTISEARRLGLLVPNKFGYLETIPPHLREGKLHEFAPFVAGAAKAVTTGALGGAAGAVAGNVLKKGSDEDGGDLIAIGTETNDQGEEMVKVTDTKGNIQLIPKTEE